MAIEAKVSRDMGNGYVQVDISAKNEGCNYYVMPKNNVNSFISQYKKDRKNNTILSYTTLGGSILLGAAAMSLLLRKLKASGTMKMFLNVCGVVPFSLFTMYQCDNYIQSKRDELMKKHKAKQVFYNA